MDELFDIAVVYKGREINFQAQLLTYTYSYKIQVDINNVLVLFEHDDEKNIRATVDPLQKNADTIDRELIKVVAQALQQILE